MVGLPGSDGSQLNRAALAGRLDKAVKPGSPRRLMTFPGDRVIPQFVDGGFWSTEVTLVNLDTDVIDASVYFLADNGGDLDVLIAGQTSKWRGMTIKLPPRESLTFETAGTDTTLSQGWAYIETGSITDKLGGLGVFRLRVPEKPDFEAVVPIVSQLENRFVLVYDNTGGRSTGMAIANPASWSESATVYIRDEDGNDLGRATMRLGGYEHMAVSLPEYWSITSNRRGLIEFAVEEFGLSAIGLRFNPTGPFTSFHTLMNYEWIE
jgi:hypothetical protein